MDGMDNVDVMDKAFFSSTQSLPSPWSTTFFLLPVDFSG
jgi:hypothetical protein